MRTTRLLVVTGLPATGKSTLALRLAARHGLPVIAKDRIKEPMLDFLPAPDAAASRRLSDASFAILFRLAADLAASGIDAILEGNFRPGEHEAAFAQIAGATVVAQVLCRAPEDVRLARLAGRQDDPARHPGHRDAALAAAGSRSGDAFLALTGLRLVYDGAGSSDLELDAALDPLFRVDPTEMQA